MYIVVLLVVYRCSVCDMSLFCLRYVIGHRTRSAPNAIRTDTVRRPIGFRPPSDQIASAVRSDCVRRPIRRRSLADDFRLGFARHEYGFLCAKTVPVGAFVGVFQSSAIDS